MKKTVLMAMMLTLAFVVSPALAEENAQMSPSVFSRGLIDQVDHSLVAIGMMMAADGLMQDGYICSGVIFQSLPDENAAYVLTNHHCVSQVALFQIKLWDKSTYLGRLLGSEPGIDTGLIRIENIPPDAYEVSPLGDSDALMVGEPVLAMGAPGTGMAMNTNRSQPSIDFGLHSTATMGVIQGKSTEAMGFPGFWASWKSEQGHQQMMTNLPWHLIVQSAVNGGNSGGPAFNSKGECIGLNHAGWNGSGIVMQNMNYTIPINFSKNYVLQLLETGKYELPWFGMDILLPPYIDGSQRGRTVGEFEERYYEPEVLKILGIRKNSPASKTNIQVGDIILEFDGQVFPTITDLRLYIFSLPIGKDIPVVVRRGKKIINLTMTSGVKRGYNSEFSF